jgi:dTMP kinase
MKKKGKFFTFEGGEGSGKTSIIPKLANHLLTLGCDVVQTREPGGTPLGESIRTLLLEHSEKKTFFSIKAEVGLFLSSRAQHVEELLLPSIDQGKIILCDRYNDSSIAYQGYARGLGIEEIENVSSFFTNNLVPDLTFYLDIDPKIGLERVKKLTHNSFDRIESESIDFHQKVRDGFHILAKKYSDRYRVIDASQTLEKVLEDIIVIIEKEI